MDEVSPKILSRFWSKVTISDTNFYENTPCWEWIGYTRNGYGRFKINGKLVTSHCFIYEYYYGEINNILDIHHLCYNRKCCNIIHLKQITHKENMLDDDSSAISKLNKEKTHCIHDHPLSGDNLGIRNDTGNRFCKTCRKNWKPSPESYELQKQRQKSRKYKDRQNFLKIERNKLKNNTK